MPLYEGEGGGPGGGASPAFSIQVAISGGDYTNPVDALNSITDNSSTKRYCIKIAPGIYTIDNSGGPVALKDFVGLTACSIRSVVFEPTDPTQDMFTGANFAYIDGVVFTGNTSGYVLNHTTTGNVNINDCVLRDCGNGLLLNGGSSILEVRRFVVNNPAATTTTYGVKVESGNFISYDIIARSTSRVTTLLDISGAGTIGAIVNVASLSPNVDTALRVYDGALVSGSVFNFVGVNDGLVVYGNNTTVRVDSFKIVQAQQDGFRIDNFGTGLQLSLYSGVVSQCTRWNFNILNPNCSVTGNGFTEIEKGNVVPGAGFYASLIDITEDDEGFNVFGELHVGIPERGAESVMGEGDSYTRSMLVYTETAGGVFTDVSEAAKSASGSTFTFPGVAADNAVYVASSLANASDVLKHFGIKVKTDTACVPGTGEIVAEYWNGSAWTEVNAMEVASSGAYYPYAKQYFERVGSCHIRYACFLESTTTDWAKNDPMTLGTDYFWMRFRIDSTITTAPVIQQFKLHTNRFEVNTDGWIEYFGKARPLSTINWNWGLFGGFFGGEMGSQPIYLSTNLYGQFSDNEWNTDGDKTGFYTALPLDCDTSCPITVKWACRPDFTGNVQWTIRWARLTEGDLTYPTSGAAPATYPTEQSIALPSEAVVTGETKTFIVDIDVSDFVSRRETSEGDILAVSIEMTTAGGDLAGFVLNPTYTKWCEGGHIG